MITNTSKLLPKDRKKGIMNSGRKGRVLKGDGDGVKWGLR